MYRHRQVDRDPRALGPFDFAAELETIAVLKPHLTHRLAFFEGPVGTVVVDQINPVGANLDMGVTAPDDAFLLGVKLDGAAGVPPKGELPACRAYREALASQAASVDHHVPVKGLRLARLHQRRQGGLAHFVPRT